MYYIKETLKMLHGMHDKSRLIISYGCRNVIAIFDPTLSFGHDRGGIFSLVCRRHTRDRERRSRTKVERRHSSQCCEVLTESARYSSIGKEKNSSKQTVIAHS